MLQLKKIFFVFLVFALIHQMAGLSFSEKPLIVPNNNINYANYKTGKIIHQFSTNLDSIGAAETILIKYVYLHPAGSDEVACAQIVVKNNVGKTIYKSSTKENKCLVIISPVGVDQLQMVYDFDNDKQMEFLILQGRSDVGLSSFNLYEWQNNSLKLIKKNVSYILNKKNNRFELVDSEKYFRNSNITYLHYLVSTLPDKMHVKANSYNLINNESCEVSLKPEEKSFSVIKRINNCKNW